MRKTGAARAYSSCRLPTTSSLRHSSRATECVHQSLSYRSRSKRRGLGGATGETVQQLSSRIPPGLPHLMRDVIASRIMRTTIDLDPAVVKELKRRSKGAGKSMGRLASELLATSLREGEGLREAQADLEWIARDLGRPLVGLQDKEAIRAVLDRRRAAPP